jgi:hypothetical protein
MAVRSGQLRPEQKLAICSGGVSLSPEDHVELLVVLVSDADSAISERAQNVLLTQPVQHFLAALARDDAAPQLFSYCAEALGDKPAIADALAKNPACPTALIARVAQYLTVEGIQALLDNLERFTSDPHLVIAVAKSPGPNAEQRELIDEMQKGALAMNEIEEVAAAIEPDPVKRQTLAQKVAHMNVVQRLTLALKGGREERMMLIRDPNRLVQRCVLQSPRLTDLEVESFAAMTNLSEEVFRTIHLTRNFMKNYTIVKNLITNPKTPLDISLHLLPRLNATDLRVLTTNKNVPETLRSMAMKLHRKRKLGASD